VAHEFEQLPEDDDAASIRLRSSEVRSRLISSSDALKRRLSAKAPLRTPERTIAVDVVAVPLSAPSDRRTVQHETWIGRQPGRALLMALAGGVALGWLVKRRRQ